MTNFDFEEIEDELDLVVPEIYRLFIEQVDEHEYDLAKRGIYNETGSLVRGNLKIRAQLHDQTPNWEDHYLDFGVGDGCGNCFFLIATDEIDDEVKLWAHDPPGIEDINSGTEFFKSLLHAFATDFKGPEQYMYQGNDW